jgi:LPXTG-motif cell wall-anchored protein
MKNRVKKLFIAITLLIALGSPYSAFADSSANSNLSQVITDCAHDSLETGSQMNEPICPIFPPKFSKFDLVNGKDLLVYGVYDAVHTVANPATDHHDLRVEFGGRTFVLGRDSELKVNGNIWVLDFSNWQNNHFMPPAPEHTYNGRVTTKLKANATSTEVVRFADFSFTTPKKTVEKTIEDAIVIPKIIKEISKALANTGINLWVIMAAGIGVIVAAFIMLFIVKKQKKRNE